MTKFEKLLEKYEETFKKPYPLCIVGDKTEEEMIEEINDCIETGTEAEEPEYYDDNVY